jgi:hypothetical protein
MEFNEEEKKENEILTFKFDKTFNNEIIKLFISYFEFNIKL